MTKRSFFLSTILLLALAFSVWLIQYSANENSAAIPKKANTPDSFMVKAVYTKMNAEGQLYSQIYTSKMTHFTQDDLSTFTNPRIVIYSKGRQPWEVTANHGISQHGIDEVTLQDNVEVHQAAGPNNQELTLTTTSLTIFPDSETAQTDQPVTISQPGTIINSVGLHADMKKGEVDLLSKARGIYEAVAN